MALINLGQARQSAAGDDLSLAYDPSQAVILPASELAAE
jgi:hypothetical protein